MHNISFVAFEYYGLEIRETIVLESHKNQSVENPKFILYMKLPKPVQNENRLEHVRNSEV